jgi:hypothetical protein
LLLSIAFFRDSLLNILLFLNFTPTKKIKKCQAIQYKI